MGSFFSDIHMWGCASVKKKALKTSINNASLAISLSPYAHPYVPYAARVYTEDVPLAPTLQKVAPSRRSELLSFELAVLRPSVRLSAQRLPTPSSRGPASPARHGTKDKSVFSGQVKSILSGG